MLKRCDKALIAISIAFSALFLVLSLTILPESMPLSLEEGAESKSPLLLCLIALLPVLSTLLTAVRDFSRWIAVLLEALIEGYALLAAANVLGLALDIPAITLTILAILSLSVSYLIYKGRITAVPAWITAEDAKKKALKLEAIMMAILSAELFIMVLLIMLLAAPGAIVIIPVMVTVIIFLLITSRI